MWCVPEACLIDGIGHVRKSVDPGENKYCGTQHKQRYESARLCICMANEHAQSPKVMRSQHCNGGDTAEWLQGGMHTL